MPLTLGTLRDRLPSATELRDRATALYRGVRASQAVADARATARAARRRWDRSRLRLDPEMARALLKVIEEEPVVPGVAGLKTTVFDKERCKHCLGLHGRNCPAVREIEYHQDGRVARVQYFDRWKDADVLWRSDIEAAAAWKDDDERVPR